MACVAVTSDCLDTSEQEDHDAHYRYGRCDACPHGQVEWGKQRENVDLFLRLAHQDSHGIVQVALAEVHYTLTLRCNGDGRYGQVSSLLKNKTKKKAAVFIFFAKTHAFDRH